MLVKFKIKSCLNFFSACKSNIKIIFLNIKFKITLYLLWFWHSKYPQHTLTNNIKNTNISINI